MKTGEHLVITVASIVGVTLTLIIASHAVEAMQGDWYDFLDNFATFLLFLIVLELGGIRRRMK